MATLKNYLLSVTLCALFISSFSIGECKSLNKGDEYFEQSNFVSAIDYYKKEMKKSPKNAYLYSQYCGAESYLYESDKSINLNETIELCNKALNLNPKNADTYFYRGRINQFLNNDDLAIDDYSNAIKLNFSI